jgi:hypothetical protein
LSIPMDIRVFLHNKVRGTSDVTAPEQRPGVGGAGSPGPLPSLAAEQIYGVGPVVHLGDSLRRHDDAEQVTRTVHDQHLGSELASGRHPPHGHTLIHGPVSGPVQRLTRKLPSAVAIGPRLDHQLSAPDLEFGCRALEGLQ